MRILEAFGWTIAQDKCEREPKQQINFLGWTWDLKRMYIKMCNLKKTRFTLLIKKIYQLNRESSPDQDKISSINNRQTEFFKSPSKRSFSLTKTNGLSKDESIEEQRMEREYDSTQGNPSRALLAVGSDSEELRNDIRSVDSRGSDGIRRIPKGLGSDSGTTNRRYFRPTWKMEQGTEEMDNQQEGDGSHILRAIPLRINFQSAANLSDPHQVRQLYRSTRFCKTQSRLNADSGSEENSQAMSITENTNYNSTYSWSFKQDNRRTKQTKSPGRFFSKEKDIHSSVPSVGDNTKIGLVPNRGKQIRGQINSNRRGSERDRVVKRVYKTMKRGDLLDPPTNSEDWKSPDRLGKVQTKVNHDSTLVARSNMVHKFTSRLQQVHYYWGKHSDSEPGERDDQKEEYATTRNNCGISLGPRVEQGRK
ncbi:MAG: hypothetical protein EZS28_001294 [Streblomastix strix]|uniref:Uncharacterized protein n=1 Tax=Streblomastix strix TaxID=222440 RepID=A0A5J4X7F8_9EUKA|nr:MAG: hypothetical protein EZS28_001294 [Streblomastix strix]